MIFESVVLSFIVGFIRKGQFLHFGLVKIKGWMFFILGAVVQFVLFKFATYSGLEWQKVLAVNFYLLHMLSYVFVLVPFVLNRQYKSLYLMAIGTILNMIAIVFNQGKMPVRLPVEQMDTVFDLGHSLLVDSTKVKFLTDIIYVGPPYPLPKVLSIGDLFLIVGVFWLIQQILLDPALKQQLDEKLTDL